MERCTTQCGCEADNTCPKCGEVFCYICCSEIIVDEDEGHASIYMQCPHCKHDWNERL
jgi:hypothetical protein